MKEKICLLGDSSVGKTSLIRRYVLDQFSDNYLSTIGAKVTKKDLTYQFGDRTVNLSLLIWDIMGQKEDYTSSSQRFPSYKPSNMYFKDTKGAIIVTDITRYETFESVAFWHSNLSREVREDIPIIFFANKVDLLDEKQWPKQSVLGEFASYNKTAYTTSAKTGENVNDGFFELGKQIVMRRL